MSEWSVGVRPLRTFDKWRIVTEKPSVDACKTWAREHRRGTSIDYEYRIYDPQGRLAFYSDPAGKTRMIWRWGPLSEREPAAKGTGQ